MADDTTTSQEDLDAAEKELHKACADAQPVKTDDTFNWLAFEVITHLASHVLDIPTPLGLVASMTLESSITVPDSEGPNKQAHCDYWRDRVTDLMNQTDRESKVPLALQEIDRKRMASDGLLQEKVHDVMKKVEKRNLMDRMLHPENAFAMASPLTAASVKNDRDVAIAKAKLSLSKHGM